jgi:hypothetical protein
MRDGLYDSSRQRKPVVTVVREEIVNTSRHPVIFSNGRLSMAPEILAGTLAMWHAQNASLHRRAVELVEVPCRQQGIAISTLGEYPLFTQLKLIRGEITDVAIVPAEQDPLLATGKFPLPRSVGNQLRAMERAGVPLDLLHTYVAHEVPVGSVVEGSIIPLEVIKPPAPAKTIRTSERLGKIAHVTTSTLLKGALVAAAVPVVAFTSVATAALLDPVIFGAIADERGMGTWFALAQWTW